MSASLPRYRRPRDLAPGSDRRIPRGASRNGAAAPSGLVRLQRIDQNDREIADEKASSKARVRSITPATGWIKGELIMPF